MIDARFVPIEKWPVKETAYTKRSPFRASYGDTLDLLERELKALYARDITIQAYFSRADIRNDGWPKSSARPRRPGVIVSFEKRGAWNSENRSWLWEEISFPCDRFDAWEDNLRAIALALEALRKIDRYGVTYQGEQYKGWARLPAATPADQMTREEAAIFIAGYSSIPKDYILQVPGQLDRAYKIAAGVLHPDRTGTPGDYEQFLRLQKARQILERG